MQSPTLNICLYSEFKKSFFMFSDKLSRCPILYNFRLLEIFLYLLTNSLL
jgi:hypothetical protein